ncbi:flagellar biosynthetic protein FliO [Sphingomonas morindae]|uniref:Flagellar biosynthetic protein FliO n=1 Tax=Sphingomonas morindae TaxID=1541170 RepID=A0ABY4X579_9SPHN|nr:flagellar biosynthetic protein FliO [Sphingomonas morindae]USI72000.1 flagellar biosynthetic protein FliO [Sphingomonas morindae]
MEAADLMRALGALALVLGLLAGALWAVRRFDLRLPGGVGGRAGARLALVERLALDNRHTLVLLRRDAAEHLLLLGPGQPLLVDSRPAADASR